MELYAFFTEEYIYLPFRLVLDHFKVTSLEGLGDFLKRDRNVEVDFDDHIEIAQAGILFCIADTEFPE